MKFLFLLVVVALTVSCHVNLGGSGSPPKGGDGDSYKPIPNESVGNFVGSCTLVAENNSNPDCTYVLSISEIGPVQSVRLLIFGQDEYWFSFRLAPGLNIEKVDKIESKAGLVDANPGHNVKSLRPEILNKQLHFNLETETAHGPMSYRMSLEKHSFGTQFKLENKTKKYFVTGNSVQRLTSGGPYELLVIPVNYPSRQGFLVYRASMETSSEPGHYRNLRVWRVFAFGQDRYWSTYFQPSHVCQLISSSDMIFSSSQIVKTETLKKGSYAVELKLAAPGTGSQKYQFGEPAELAADIETAEEFICTGGKF